MVDTKGGNNMLYLPLDKIMQQAAQDAGKPSSSSLGLPGASQPAIPRAPARSSASGQSSSGSSNSNTLPRDRMSR